MNRKYTRERYLDRVAAIRRIIPQLRTEHRHLRRRPLETEEDHQSLSLTRECGYDSSFMFKYSERPAPTLTPLARRCARGGENTPS